MILLKLLNQAFLFSYTAKALASVSILTILLTSILFLIFSENTLCFLLSCLLFLKRQTTTGLMVLGVSSRSHHGSLDILNNSYSMSSGNRFFHNYFLILCFDVSCVLLFSSGTRHFCACTAVVLDEQNTLA